jgi:hypothetical protein
MRKSVFSGVCLLVLVACALVGAGGEANVKVRLQLVDAARGRKIGGMVRVIPANAARPVELPGLLDRLRGLKKTETLTGWYVVPAAGAETMLARGRYRVEALSGLETALARQEVEVGADGPQSVSIELNALFRPGNSGLAAGNTHLHLQGLNKDECEDYLRQVPAADGIRVMFISYLERADIDKAYITNRYPVGDLGEFAMTGVLFNNGEEHRHNFEAWGQGFGHVMFLDIKELVKPVSLGPGITGQGNDDRPLRPGIEEARRQGGTVIWCHNSLGHEDVPNALAGRLDALNVFDGSRGGTYEDNYYRYLNTGMHLPISTGTDWFIYDFSRVYARVEGELTVKSWLTALKAGRNQATNGPLLTLTVDGKPVGETLKVQKPVRSRIVATALGRRDFQRLQMVFNGRVIHTESSRSADGGFQARIERDVPVDGPGWFAVRIESDAKNELDQQLFAHTSPVYVEMAGRRLFDIESARALQKQMEESRADIRSKGKFTSDAARDQLLAMYDASIRSLTEQINRRRP